MPEVEMELAIQHSRQCDLSLVLGTSLFVQPAASLPDKVLKNPNGKLVVVNLQRTPMDKQCSIRIFSKTDKFMELLLDNLGVKNINVEYDHIQQMKNKKKSILHCGLLVLLLLLVFLFFSTRKNFKKKIL